MSFDLWLIEEKVKVIGYEKTLKFQNIASLVVSLEQISEMIKKNDCTQKTESGKYKCRLNSNQLDNYNYFKNELMQVFQILTNEEVQNNLEQDFHFYEDILEEFKILNDWCKSKNGIPKKEEDLEIIEIAIKNEMSKAKNSPENYEYNLSPESDNISSANNPKNFRNMFFSFKKDKLKSREIMEPKYMIQDDDEQGTPMTGSPMTGLVMDFAGLQDNFDYCSEEIGPEFEANKILMVDESNKNTTIEKDENLDRVVPKSTNFFMKKILKISNNVFDFFTEKEQRDLVIKYEERNKTPKMNLIHDLSKKIISERQCEKWGIVDLNNEAIYDKNKKMFGGNLIRSKRRRINEEFRPRLPLGNLARNYRIKEVVFFGLL